MEVQHLLQPKKLLNAALRKAAAQPDFNIIYIHILQLLRVFYIEYLPVRAKKAGLNEFATHKPISNRLVAKAFLEPEINIIHKNDATTFYERWY